MTWHDAQLRTWEDGPQTAPAVKTVVILMSDTGGGHRSAAEALAAVMAEGQPEPAHVELLDFIACAAPWPLSRVGRLYEPTVNHLPWGWWALYHLTDGRLCIGLILRLLTPLVTPRLTAELARHAPNVIVSVHPLANHLAVRCAGALPNHPPVVTVVTDLLTTHAGWFHPGVRRCIVATPQARERALACGLPAERVAVIGLPVHPRFQPPADNKAAIRRKLGLEPDRFTVLLVGGGEGMGKLYELARAVAGARLPVQLVVIAGRNQRLQHRLEAVAWELPVVVRGFVRNMPDWMSAADCIATKAGPGTISEALVMGLPILLHGYVPGQEGGNVRFVVEGGAGLLTPTPQALVEALRVLSRPGDSALARMAANARRLARPEAASEIARLILAIK